jgi:penicillin-binding protein 1B
MANFAPRLPSRRTVFQVLSICVVTLLVLLALLSLYVYKQSVGKFEIRRLSLPTRIYTDYVSLKPGVILPPDDLVERLQRLGYRQVPALAQPGDYQLATNIIGIWTRAFTHPSGKYESEPVKLTFRGAQIESVVSARDGSPRQNVAVEPELLTSILNDQLENRRPVTLDQIPKSLQDAVVVTEDVRFWHHPGVDPIGLMRALFRNVRAGGVTEGGSTLTQQLVKNYYLTGERTFRRKAVEAFMAVILDAKYSKREILEAYLNDIYLGRNRSISILGVGEAARFYFGKPVSEINVAEAALLAGIIKSPNNYSPFVRPDLALQRRKTVLGLMLRNGKIDQATYERALATPLPRQPFRQRSGLGSIPFYVDRVLQEMSSDYGIKDVKGRGLQIYTAIDLNAQDFAATTLEKGLEQLEKSHRNLRRSDSPLQGVMIHVDVASSEIRALVGGRNYDLSQFNRALNAKRQIGSLVKPFVYATAFEPSLSSQNITPATLVSDQPFTLKRRFAADWTPRNYENRYHDTVTVREALEQSLNSASVRIGLACGLEPIIRSMHTLGVVSDVDAQPALLLGAAGIAPIEMADSYATIGRLGSRIPLHTIRFVTDDRGHEVTSGGGLEPVQVFPARDLYILVNTMKGVVDRGTAAGVRSMGFKLTAAGKTGTTNDKRDAWFIGFTPKQLELTWLGFDDNRPIGLSGGEGAVPIWTRYMLAATAGQPNVDWFPPPNIVFTQDDETSGGLATPNCPPRSIVTDAFKAGTQPTNPCPTHSPQAPLLPAVDQFGNPITLDTTGQLPRSGETTTLPPLEQTDTTLTGGVFRTDTGAPRPPVAPPPPTTTRERTSPSAPPPSTNTSEPPTATNTSAPPAPPP